MNFVFYLNAKLYHNSRQQFFQHVQAKYSKFVDLNKSEKVIFLFNYIDRYVVKKNLTTIYVYEAFQLREFYSIKQKHQK